MRGEVDEDISRNSMGCCRAIYQLLVKARMIGSEADVGGMTERRRMGEAQNSTEEA